MPHLPHRDALTVGLEISTDADCRPGLVFLHGCLRIVLYASVKMVYTIVVHLEAKPVSAGVMSSSSECRAVGLDRAGSTHRAAVRDGGMSRQEAG